MRSLLVFALIFSSLPALAEPGPLRFEDYPVESSLETCAPLDFRSLSLARNHQDRILSGKPDLTKPNFGGRYLLLNLSLMLEDLWLIADCGSGKFLSPILEGRALFQKQSLLLELKTKNGAEWQAWRNGGWVRIGLAEAPRPQASPQPSAPPSPSSPSPPCHQPDFTSNFKADGVRDHLLKFHSDWTKANFSQHYLVMKNELLFETRWFLMDCRTGRFEKETLIADRVTSQPESDVLILQDEGKPPRRMKWRRSQWIEMPEPSNPNRPVRNTLEGSEARSFLAKLPKAGDRNRMDFESFLCEWNSEGMPVLCRAQVLHHGAPPEQVRFRPDDLPWLSELVKDFGMEELPPRPGIRVFGMTSGFCLREKSRCEFETRSGRVGP